MPYAPTTTSRPRQSRALHGSLGVGSDLHAQGITMSGS